MEEKGTFLFLGTVQSTRLFVSALRLNMFAYWSIVKRLVVKSMVVAYRKPASCLPLTSLSAQVFLLQLDSGRFCHCPRL